MMWQRRPKCQRAQKAGTRLGARDPAFMRRAAGRTATLAIVALVALLAVVVGAIVYSLSGAGTLTAPTPKQQVETALDEAGQALRQGDYARAEAVLRKVEPTAPRDQDLRLALAKALMGQKRFADAHGQLEAAIQIGPATPAIHHDAGTVASKASMPERAAEHYAAAQSLDPSNPSHPLFLGMVLNGQGRSVEATAALLHAVKLNPDLAEAWGVLADIQLRDGNTGLALQHIEKARKLQPLNLVWRQVEARTLNRGNRPEDAVAVLSGVPEEELFQARTLATLGESYGLLKQPERAVDLYVRATQARPAEAELHYQLAIWRERTGDKGGARMAAERARQLGDQRAAAVLERVKED